MTPEESQQLETAIAQHGAARVLQVILKQYPNLRENVLDLVGEVGIEKAIRQMFGLAEPTPVPGPASIPMPEPLGAVPDIGSSNPKVAMDIPLSSENFQVRERGVNEVGVGGQPMQSMSTAPITQKPEGITSPRSVRMPELSQSRSPAVMTPEQGGTQAPSEQARLSRQRPAPGAAVPPGETPLMDMPPAEMPALTNLDLSNINPGRGIVELDPAGEPGLNIPPGIMKKQWEKMKEESVSLSTLCKKHRVPIQMLVAIVKQESNFKPKAKSPAGAIGLMQLMAGTARDQGLTVSTKLDERFLPKKNLSAGLSYLNWLKSNFNPKTLDQWLAAYNAGPSRLKNDNWKKIGETQTYINRIKRRMQTYKDKPAVYGKDLSALLENL